MFDKNSARNFCVILFISFGAFCMTICALLLAKEYNLSSMLLGTPPRLEWETLLTGFAAVIAAVLIYSRQEKQQQYHIDNNWKIRGEELYGKLAFAEITLSQARTTFESSKLEHFSSQLLSLKFQLQPLLELNAETLTHFGIALPYIQIKLRSKAMIDLIENCIGNNLKFDLNNKSHQHLTQGFEALASVMDSDLRATQQMMQKKLSAHQRAVKKFEN